MNRKEKAIDLFSQQFNCSQAIFAAYCNKDVLDEANALKIATVFGAGTACTGCELCGALAGGLLALSLRYGRGDLQSLDAKEKTYALGKHLLNEFTAQMGASRCEEILGLNISTPENLARAKESKLFETRCLEAVKTTAEILEKML